MTRAFAGERAVVVGYGTSGRAAAAVLLDEGADVRVTEERPRTEVGEPDPEVDLRAGGHQPEDLDRATLVVLSPGVPEHAPVIGWARDRGLPLWSELELGARLCRVPFVAVTGTNGKTTTVEMVAGAMRAAGLNATACGNVGYPFSLAARKGYDALAVEASSFQLRFSHTLHPTVSVLLNVAPDHLDWHGSLHAYAETKARVFARQGEGDVHVGNRDDARAAAISAAAPCDLAWFRWGPPLEGEVGVVDGRLVTRIGPELDLGRPPGAAGKAFLTDAAAAAAAALSFGLPEAAVKDTLASFAPLPHRGSEVARIGMVKFLDDSKATNPHAALAALDGLTKVVLIAGGQPKGVDLSPLALAAPRLTAVVAIGEAAAQLVDVFDGLVPVRTASSIERAVETAYGWAESDGTIALAPACASQDMFRDYKERGDRFAAAARDLAARIARSGGGPRLDTSPTGGPPPHRTAHPTQRRRPHA